MNSIVICYILLCIILSAGCITDIIQEADKVSIQEADNVFIPNVVVEPTELDKLLQFLEEDKTDEVIYHKDPQMGMDYYVCTGFTRTLAENASKYNITMGAITLRETPTVGTCTKYYHAMNYVIIDDSFIIIEPQLDEVFYLDLIGYHNGGVYRYITIYENAQMMSNYGKGRQTVDIDLRDYNETEIVERWG